MFHFCYSALNRVLEPTILMETTLSDGAVHTFEVSSEKKSQTITRKTACLYTTHVIARYFLPTIFWVLVIRIANKHHVYVGCKIVGEGEESG